MSNNQDSSSDAIDALADSQGADQPSATRRSRFSTLVTHRFLPGTAIGLVALTAPGFLLGAGYLSESPQSGQRAADPATAQLTSIAAASRGFTAARPLAFATETRVSDPYDDTVMGAINGVAPGRGIGTVAGADLRPARDTGRLNVSLGEIEGLTLPAIEGSGRISAVFDPLYLTRNKISHFASELAQNASLGRGAISSAPLRVGLDIKESIGSPALATHDAITAITAASSHAGLALGNIEALIGPAFAGTVDRLAVSLQGKARSYAARAEASASLAPARSSLTAEPSRALQADAARLAVLDVSLGPPDTTLAQRSNASARIASKSGVLDGERKGPLALLAEREQAAIAPKAPPVRAPRPAQVSQQPRATFLDTAPGPRALAAAADFAEIPTLSLSTRAVFTPEVAIESAPVQPSKTDTATLIPTTIPEQALAPQMAEGSLPKRAGKPIAFSAVVPEPNLLANQSLAFAAPVIDVSSVELPRGQVDKAARQRISAHLNRPRDYAVQPVSIAGTPSAPAISALDLSLAPMAAPLVPPPASPTPAPSQIERNALTGFIDPRRPASLPKAFGAGLELDIKSSLDARINGKVVGKIDFTQSVSSLSVRLGSVVDLLKDRFDMAELERIRSSSANELFISLPQLREAGIPITYDPVYDEFNVGTRDHQPKAAHKVQIDQISDVIPSSNQTAVEQIRR